MARNWCKFLLSCCFFKEPAGLRRFNNEFEGTIGKGSEFNLERNVSSYVCGNFIELFAEFHHVDTKWTK